MSAFLSKIKARLEPGQHDETGWVRAALESMEQQGTQEDVSGSEAVVLADLVHRMAGVALESSPEAHVGGDRDDSSPQSASQTLWETGNLSGPLPDGFCSFAPENSKMNFKGCNLDVSAWDVILVDPRQDKTLLRLKEICLDYAEGLEPNSTDMIRRIASMVADYYGGPLFETGYHKDVTSTDGVTLLSQVKVGLCRPRALLFKYLGDAVGLTSRLLMGLQLDSVPSTSLICSNPRRHLTNVVNVNGKDLLVDVMRHPGHLRPFTVKALVMYHISGPGDSDSAEYDSCDSPLEPNSPLFFNPQDRADSASPSQSEPDVSNMSLRHNRRRSMSDDRGNKSSPELPSEVRYLQRRHMVDGARSFPSSPEHPQVRLRSFRPIKSQEGSNSSSPESGGRARAPSILSGSRRTDEDRPSTSSPENSPQYSNLVPAFRRRSSSFCVRDAFDMTTISSSETRRVKKRTNVPEISDDVVRAIRAINEAVRQGRKSSEQDSQSRFTPVINNEIEELREGTTGSEQSSLNFGGSSSSTTSVASAAMCRERGLTSSLLADFLPDHPLMPYTEWNIDYSELKIHNRIGIGSFGEVFRATWRGTEVAVKVMHEQHLTKENTEDFFNEISLLSRLRHPNVILFMGACMTPPRLATVTEYMHMGSLYDLLHRTEQGKQLSWRRKLKMLHDICKGMMCLQRMNIIHRDLKSANCLVDKHWRVKICDFGLSRLCTDGPTIQEGTAAGTPEWMAPELLRNEAVTYKCDVFSLGVIMWELCSLKRPWHGLQPVQVVQEVSVEGSRLEIPQGPLGKLISDCWQENPEERPSYDDILARLDNILKRLRDYEVLLG